MENHDVALNKYVAVFGHDCNTLVGCFLAENRESVEEVVWQDARNDLEGYIGLHGILDYYEFLESENLEDCIEAEEQYEDYLSSMVDYTIREFDPDNEEHLDILSECNNEWYEV